ncbi:hypothetical protein CDD81_7052 [Ophiocordyceps australis]|uniref:Phenazine biosynthesis protein n=1 Tax=Ophiocordyceps australis TaxID=1399860 RepID=A0A2C5YCY0_9HYPO|nr:hypothetical protein CDD81_7052 [Ophiocordyceps australis]
MPNMSQLAATELPFVTYDVFTDTRFQGNPLAIVTIPHGQPKPSHHQLQKIAREFNLSETIFIHDVPDAAQDKTRRVQIFLPDCEIALAGHPLIGAAVSLLDSDNAHQVHQLMTRAGPVDLAKLSHRTVQANIPHQVHLHSRQLRQTTLPSFHLQPDAQVCHAEAHAPVVDIVSGVTFILTPLASLDALSRVSLVGGTVNHHELLDQGHGPGLIGRCYYHVTGEHKDQDGTHVISIRSRIMVSAFEDPATGAAASCLASYLSAYKNKHHNSTRRYHITQGVEMGKESHIIVDVSTNGSNIDKVKLAGTAVQVMRGHLKL